MKPIETPHTNRLYKLQGGTEENDLPARLGQDEEGFPFVHTTWEPTQAERAAIAAGASIELFVWGGGTPPVALGVDEAWL